MLRQDIHTLDFQKKKKNRRTLLHEESLQLGQSPRRTVPIGEKRRIDASVFFHLLFQIFFYFYFFLRFFPIQLKSVGSRKKEEGGHFGTVDPISRLYISVTFFFFFLYFIYFFSFFFIKKKTTDGKGKRWGGVSFLCVHVAGLVQFSFFLYMCVCVTQFVLSFISASHSLVTPEPITSKLRP